MGSAGSLRYDRVLLVVYLYLIFSKVPWQDLINHLTDLKFGSWSGFRGSLLTLDIQNPPVIPGDDRCDPHSIAMTGCLG